MPSQWLAPQGHISPNFGCPLWWGGESQARSVCFCPGATESPPSPSHQLGWNNLHHRDRWDERTPSKHPLAPDLLLRQPSQGFQKHCQENKENSKTVVLYYARACSLCWSQQSALCVTWASLPCFPACESVSLSMHLLRTLCPSVLLSFAFFPPPRPTVPARGPEPG